jgi:phytoene dehydrogenase-like protein
MTATILIVGGGLAGMACARYLQDAGRECQILEASDGPGGRIRTDVHEGFRLDRGFQVFLPAYPDARQLLDYDALDLRAFEPGACIWHQGRFHTLADPLRCPHLALATLFSRLITLGDKYRTLALRCRVSRGSLDDLMHRPQVRTIDHLRELRFSDAMISRFFMPWLRGIFLEPQLETSSRKFEFVFRMFAQGGAALPAQGMRAIPLQLASKLKPGTLRLHTPVVRVEPGRVTLADGQTLQSPAVVVATDRPAAARLLGESLLLRGCRSRCLYFAAPSPPRRGKLLLLNGMQDQGPVSHVAVLSEVAPSYAPPGQTLICAAIDPSEPRPAAELEQPVRAQMSQWFGPAVTATWRLLRCDDIAYALPAQPVAALDPAQRSPRLAPGLLRCSDDLDLASIQGALASGRRAAQAILSEC